MSRLKLSIMGLVGIVTILVTIAVGFNVVLEAQSPEGEVDPANLDPEGQPLQESELSPTGELEAGEEPLTSQAIAFFFKRVAGSTFNPRESSTTKAYGGAGCVYRTSTSGFFTTDLQIPDGAEIDFLRAYFYDTNTTHNVTAYLYSYDGAGDFTEIASASSTGAPGYGSAGSGVFSHQVDNETESLALVLGFGGANSNNLRVCDVQVRYKLDISQLYFPAVLDMTNP